MARVVISDTSPVRYLVLIGHAELLFALYASVLIPKTVAEELSRPSTPEEVRRWIADPPFWLQVVPPAAGIAYLTVTGTLGVLDRAAELRLIELAPAIAKLRRTNFRIDPAILDRLLSSDRRRRQD